MLIRDKLTTTFLALAIIPMLFVGYIILYSTDKNLRDQILDKLEIVADGKVKEIESFISERKSDMVVLQHRNVLWTNFPILDQFRNDRADPAYITAKTAVDSQLSVFLSSYKYADVFLANKQGQIIYVLDPAHEPKTDEFLSGKDIVLQKPNSEINLGDIRKTTDKKYPYVLPMAGSLYSQTNEVIGTVYAVVDMGMIYRIMAKETSREHYEETFLVKRMPDNKVLFLSPLADDPEAILRKTVIFGDKVAVPSQKAALGETGSGLSRGTGPVSLAAGPFVGLGAGRKS